MRKLLLVAAFFFAVSVTSQAQENFKFGGNLGIPVGDADVYDISYGAEAAYLFEVSDGFLVGPMIGYQGYSVDDLSVSFLPIAASGRYMFPTSNFFLGADLGYALGLEDGLDGGFYYRPKVGYDIGIFGLIASYSGISVDGGTFSSINLGVEFSL